MRQESTKGKMNQDETEKRDIEEQEDSRAGRRTVNTSSRVQGREMGESGPGPPGTDTESGQQ